MKTLLNDSLHKLTIAVCLTGFAGVTSAQDAPRFTEIQRLPNREILLKLDAPAGASYRIDASTNLLDWISLITARSTGPNQQKTDSSAPYLASRFYRAVQVQVSGAPALVGDHVTTANGDVVIQPLFHASFVMSWNGKIIYNDPDDDAAFISRYQGLPQRRPDFSEPFPWRSL